MFISFLKKFYLNIVDLQYCLSLVYSTVDQLYIQIFIIIQLLSCVGLFAAPWIAAHQASLSFTISWSLFKLMSIYPLFFRFFCHIDHYRVLSRVPCAIQWVLISYLFYIQQCVYVSRSHPIYPSSLLILFPAFSLHHGLPCAALPHQGSLFFAWGVPQRSRVEGL